MSNPTVTLKFPDELDMDLDMNVAVAPLTATVGASLAITQIPAIQIGITQLPVVQIAVVQLPLIDMRFRMWPTRVHLPVDMKFAVCAFGKELLSFSACGESMVVVEDYVPHHMELCS